ncbi:MAG: 2-C-methyl-D-erythritol 4-phosphate cytidylyltransferase [Fervidobacterium sp.]|nr:2-C-methyl-D-erythritol 4-phosphate cytidylyltransferase [Fervidobacterium sp.]
MGTRFGWIKPKQFYPILGEKTIIEYLVEKFLSFDIFDKIVVISPSSYIEETKNILSKHLMLVSVVEGGDTRERSIWNGLSFLKGSAKEDDIVLIHDGARPLISKELIKANIDLCVNLGAVVTSVVSTDTLSYSENGESIDKVVERNKVRLHQTPQTFKFGIVKTAMERNFQRLDTFSDDASVVLASGYKVYYIEGHRLNIKITTQDDLDILRYIINKGGRSV